MAEPPVAKVGRPITLYDTGNVDLRSYDPPKWASAVITVTSIKTLKTVPGIPAKIRPAPHTMYALADVRTTITADPFTLWNDHFHLTAPDGTEYPRDLNAAYLADAFRDSTSSKMLETKGALGPGDGLLLFSIPDTGLPPGTKLTAELWKGNACSWQLP